MQLEREDALVSGRGSGRTRPANILLVSWRGDRHCCVVLVVVSPAGSNWRQAAEALSLSSGGNACQALLLLVDSVIFSIR